MSPRTAASEPLPREFGHDAIQTMFRKGRATGQVTDEDVAIAIRDAGLTPRRARVVLATLTEQGIEVHVPQDAPKKTTGGSATTGRKSTAASASKTAESTTKKTTTK